MLLTDIAVEHTLVSKKDGVRQTFLLHPFTDTQRDSLGKFELVRDVSQPGLKDVKRSTLYRFTNWRSCMPKACSKNLGFPFACVRVKAPTLPNFQPKKYCPPASSRALRSTWQCKRWMYRNRPRAN